MHNVLDLANLYSVSQCFCADLQKAFCDYWYERFIVTIMSSCLLCILHGSFIGHVINFPAFIVWFTEELNAIDAGNLPCIDLLLFCHSFAFLVLHVSRWILYNCRFAEKKNYVTLSIHSLDNNDFHHHRHMHRRMPMVITMWCGVNGCQILDCFRYRDPDCYRDCGDLRFIPRSM